MFDHVGEIHLGQAHVVVLVSFELTKGLEVLGGQLLDDPFGQDRRPVVMAQALTPDDRTGQDVGEVVEADGPIAELLGDDGQRGTGCLANA